MKILDEISEQLRLRKMAVFCGAGISYNSGVPLVNEIKEAILDKLALKKEDHNNLLDFQMPFELFMETVITHSGNNKLFDLFEIGKPNTNHHFIAELSRLGMLKYVITTNFDNHLEVAFETAHVPYKLYYTESDFEDLDTIYDGVKLIKLHGSIHDKENIAITIRKVAGRQLIAYRKKVIEDILNNFSIESILFLGYSFSDIFDITPNFQKFIPPHFRIFNIDHQFNYDYVPQISSLSDLKDGELFEKDVKGTDLLVNTDSVIKTFWLSLIGDTYSFIDRVPAKYEMIIDDWYEKAVADNSKFVNEFLAGQLLNTIASNQSALNYFLAALSADSMTEELSINFLYVTGMTYRELQKQKGSLENSLRYLYQGLKLAQKYRNHSKIMVFSQSLGIALADKKFYYLAIQFYEDALRIARRIDNQEIEGKCLGNVGLALKNISINYFSKKARILKFAVNFLKRSLTLAEVVGDKRSEGRTWGNIGITYSELGDKAYAITCYKTAQRISDDLNDILHQGIWEYNIGYDYIGWDNVLAKKHIIAAKTIFSSKGWENHIAECDESLASLL
jgi:tetratricopeptide (TPR) repeat protein